jgi:hypothetical protein
MSKPEVIVFQSNPPHGRWRVVVTNVDLPPPVRYLDEGFSGACLYRGSQGDAREFAAFLKRMMEMS